MKFLYFIGLLTVPLFPAAQEEKQPGVFTLFPTNDHCWLNAGSGIVFKKDGDYFLVTALHVLAKTPKKFEKYWPESTLGNTYKYLYFGSAYPKLKSSFFIRLTDSLTGLANYKTFSLAGQLLDIAIIKLDQNDSCLHFMFKNAIAISDIDTDSELSRDHFLQVVGSPPYKTSRNNLYGINPRKDRDNPAIFRFDFEQAEQNLAGLSGGIVYKNEDIVKQVPMGILVAAADDGSFGLGIYLKFVHELIECWD